MTGVFATAISGGFLLLVFAALWLNARGSFAHLRAEYDKIKQDFNRADREAQYYKIACENANDGVLIQGLDGCILWVNPAYCRIMGRPAHEMMGRNPLSFALPEEDRPSPREIAEFQFDPATIRKDDLSLFRNIRGDGSLFWNQINASHNIAPDGTQSIILVCRDVTQQIMKEKRLKETSTKLAYLAAHDDLTGVANRQALARFVDDHLTGSRNADRFLGLFHIDLDKFKIINDTHGHAAGDAALKYIATKLKTALRQTDMIARIGGDEFVVACPGLRDLNEIHKIGAALQQSVVEPLAWEGCTIRCRISIGASLSTSGLKSGSELLQQSDFALYDAKRSGRGQLVIYDKVLRRRHTRQRGLANELQAAKSSGALEVDFKAAKHLKRGHITGVETVISWKHPIMGRLALDDFIDIAKSTNLMADIGFAAMDAALELKSQLATSCHNEVYVGFSASPECLAHPQFHQKLMARVAKLNLDPAGIVIKLNETSFSETTGRSGSYLDMINTLNKSGFITMIDDFGMGHAGIVHLPKLNVRAIQIDAQLVATLSEEPTTRLILKTILQLCDDLDLYAIIDGVVTQEQLDVLGKIGCRTIQGPIVGPNIACHDVFGFLDGATNGTVPFARSPIAPDAKPRYLRANS